MISNPKVIIWQILLFFISNIAWNSQSCKFLSTIIFDFLRVCGCVFRRYYWTQFFLFCVCVFSRYYFPNTQKGETHKWANPYSSPIISNMRRVPATWRQIRVGAHRTQRWKLGASLIILCQLQPRWDCLIIKIFTYFFFPFLFLSRNLYVLMDSNNVHLTNYSNRIYTYIFIIFGLLLKQ